MKTRFFKFLLMILTVVSLTAEAQSQTPPLANEFRPVFSKAISDLPIMPGLTEETESIVIFDKPNGRFIETSASGNVPPQKISHFYRQALPALGWQAQAEGQYRRGQDNLILAIKSDQPQSRISFTITPDGPSQ